MNAIKRAGMTISQDGRQGHFPQWDDARFSGAQPGSWVGRAGSARATALAIGQRLHGLNESVRLAKAANRQAPVPEVDVRIALARKDQRALRDLRLAADHVSTQMATKREELRRKTLDYASDGFSAVLIRQELRHHLRSLPSDQRMQAMKREKFRMAALEVEPEISGLPATIHEDLVQAEIAAKFPQDVEDLEVADEAVGNAKETIGVVERAVHNELLAVGQQIGEPAPPTPTPAWV